MRIDENLVIKTAEISAEDLNEISYKYENYVEKNSLIFRVGFIIFLLFVLISTGVIIDAIMSGITLLEQIPIVAYVYFSLVAFFVCYVFYTIWYEYRGLSILKKSKDLSIKAQKLEKEPSKALVRFGFLILSQLERTKDKELLEKIKKCGDQLNQISTYEDVLYILDKEIFTYLDLKAKEIIKKHSITSATVTAISPLASIDMIFVIWRGYKMVGELCYLYGLQPSMSGKIAILKESLYGVAFVGGSQIAVDGIQNLIGVGALSKISYNISQGLASGVFVARLGVSTVNILKPINKDFKISFFKEILKEIYKKLVY